MRINVETDPQTQSDRIAERNNESRFGVRAGVGGGDNVGVSMGAKNLWLE